MAHSSRASASLPKAPGDFAVEAFVTLVAALFAFLALDDITTDNATTGFRPEYTILTFCGIWLLLFGIQLWRKGLRRMAGVSLLLLGGAWWVTRDGLGHKNAGGWSVFWPEYAVVCAAWLWFTANAAMLLAREFRSAGAAAASGSAGRQQE